MNIFALDNDPRLAAQYLCDKHISKMIVESAQLLSTLARHMCGNAKCDAVGLYKSTHTKHPCQLWLREHHHNWGWLWQHVVWIHSQWRLRYRHFDVEHKSMLVAQQAAILLGKHSGIDINIENHTPFVQCMLEKYRILGDPVTAYRNYYRGEKAGFAKWEKGTAAPEWWTKKG